MIEEKKKGSALFDYALHRRNSHFFLLIRLLLSLFIIHELLLLLSSLFLLYLLFFLSSPMLSLLGRTTFFLLFASFGNPSEPSVVGRRRLLPQEHLNNTPARQTFGFVRDRKGETGLRTRSKFESCFSRICFTRRVLGWYGRQTL